MNSYNFNKKGHIINGNGVRVPDDDERSSVFIEYRNYLRAGNAVEYDDHDMEDVVTPITNTGSGTDGSNSRRWVAVGRSDVGEGKFFNDYQGFSDVQTVIINNIDPTGADLEKWHMTAQALATANSPIYLQITEVDNNRIVGIFKVTQVDKTESSNGGAYQYKIDSTISSNGGITIGKAYTISWTASGRDGKDGALSGRWNKSSMLIDGNPGLGGFWSNSTSLNGATEFRISKFAIGAVNYAGWFQSLQNIAWTGVERYLQVTEVGTNNVLAIYSISSVTFVSDSPDWYTITVGTSFAATGNFSNIAEYSISWSAVGPGPQGIPGPKGDPGDSGTGGGETFTHSNSIFVDPHGDDGRAEIGNKQNPFRTIAGAINQASKIGEREPTFFTIIVYPGYYEETERWQFINYRGTVKFIGHVLVNFSVDSIDRTPWVRFIDSTVNFIGDDRGFAGNVLRAEGSPNRSGAYIKINDNISGPIYFFVFERSNVKFQHIKIDSGSFGRIWVDQESEGKSILEIDNCILKSLVYPNIEIAQNEFKESPVLEFVPDIIIRNSILSTQGPNILYNSWTGTIDTGEGALLIDNSTLYINPIRTRLSDEDVEAPILGGGAAPKPGDASPRGISNGEITAHIASTLTGPDQLRLIFSGTKFYTEGFVDGAVVEAGTNGCVYFDDSGTNVKIDITSTYANCRAYLGQTQRIETIEGIHEIRDIMNPKKYIDFS